MPVPATSSSHQSPARAFARRRPGTTSGRHRVPVQVAGSAADWLEARYVTSRSSSIPSERCRAHTVDVRAAQTDTERCRFNEHVDQVSNYPLVFDTESRPPIQLQFNFINAALFGGGQVPFLGDYNDTAAEKRFHPAAVHRRDVHGADFAGSSTTSRMSRRSSTCSGPTIAICFRPARMPQRSTTRITARRGRRRASRGRYQAGHAVVDSQPESLHRVPRRRVRDAGGGQRAADSGSREARLRRPDAEPRGAGRQSTNDVQEAVPADACREQRSGVVQFRHRLHQPLVDPADDFHRPGLRLGRREDGVRPEGRDGSRRSCSARKSARSTPAGTAIPITSCGQTSDPCTLVTGRGEEPGHHRARSPGTGAGTRRGESRCDPPDSAGVAAEREARVTA